MMRVQESHWTREQGSQDRSAGWHRMRLRLSPHPPMIPSIAVDAHRAAPDGIQVESLQQQALAGSRASSTGRQAGRQL